jgi:hypothetical protein
MTESPPPQSAHEVEEPDPLAFTPVVTIVRHDGWTPDRQRKFISALEAIGSVAPAARAVGMSKQSAYALRKRPGAESFAQAWDIALQMGQDRAFDIVMDRAMHGVIVPRFYRGRCIGTIHRWDSRLLLAALRETAPPFPASERET